MPQDVKAETVVGDASHYSFIDALHYLQNCQKASRGRLLASRGLKMRSWGRSFLKCDFVNDLRKAETARLIRSLEMEYSKGLKFLGDLDELEKCVSQTGLDGRWIKLPDGHRQFVTDDGGVLNWSCYAGDIWFRGKSSAAKVFKREFKAAAKGRVEWQKSPEEKGVSSSDTEKSLRR